MPYTLPPNDLYEKYIPVIFQVAALLPALDYVAHPWATPLKGPLQAAFKSAPGRFVTPVTYSSKRLGMSELAA
ncbi:hypothetical protein BSR03_12065 [Serratia proteamaculans]|nr:hypothetical protein BSR03_12065 [Serratia proteamaculans]